MKKRYLYQRFCHSLRHMRLSDRCLCLFLLFLLIQSACHIFIAPDLTKQFDAMDAMIRSSAATIFGYFISNAFGSSSNTAESKITLKSREKNISTQTAEEIRLPSCQKCRIHQQILIVASVGFFSMIILTYVRICGVLSENTIAGLSQFQDFLVGSIGFLVGHAKYEQV